MSKKDTDTAANLCRLEEGESVSWTERLPVDALKTGDVQRRVATMRNRMNQYVTRARDRTGRTFKVETGHFVTHDGAAIMVVAAATRLASEDASDI